MLFVTLGSFVSYRWLRSYLHSEDFRHLMGQLTGSFLKSDVNYGNFHWEGMRVSSPTFSSTGHNGSPDLQAEGLKASIQLQGVKRGVWEIPNLRASRLNIQWEEPAPVVNSGEVAMSGNANPVKVDTTAVSHKQSFWSRFLPQYAEVQSMDVYQLDAQAKLLEGDLIVSGVTAKVEKQSGQSNYSVDLRNGSLALPWIKSELELHQANGRWQNGKVYINDAKADFYKNGLLSCSGELQGNSFDIYTEVSGLRCEELLDNVWSKRCQGDLAGRMNVTNYSGQVVTKGEMKVKKGVLTGLEPLDVIASYTMNRRFTRLSLSDVSWKFKRYGDVLELDDMFIASEGLIQLRGYLHINGEQLDGKFKVGITPGTLAHIPGAETKVFLPGELGMRWTDIRIGGTKSAPTEDLTARLIQAAGERLFEIIPETGVKVLKLTGKALGEGASGIVGSGGGVIETGTGLIESGASALPTEVLTEGVKTGAGVIDSGVGAVEGGIRGVFGLLPGSTSERAEPAEEEKEDKE